MEQDGTDHTDLATGLTEKQVVALPYVAAATTLSEGARLASIGRTTLRRWMEDDQFRRALENARAEAADLARTEIQGLMLKAVHVFAESLDHPKPEVRLRAASAAMALGLKVVDLKELNRRLDYLDDTVDLMRNKRANSPFLGMGGR